MGCKVKGDFLCFSDDMACCKPITVKNESGQCCAFFEGGSYCAMPKTCAQCQSQMCCIDGRCAFPCTADVPCLCTCLPCCVVYPKIGCCKKVSSLTGTNDAVTVQPAQQEMY